MGQKFLSDLSARHAQNMLINPTMHNTELAFVGFVFSSSLGRVAVTSFRI